MKVLPEISAETASWIRAQRVFFVGSAPTSADGHVNISPKGGDSLRVLGPLQVAYQDYTGSGAETAAHLRENGRLVIMLCAFEGPPKILRLHGIGTYHTTGTPGFEKVVHHFPQNAGTRAIVHLEVTRVSQSCGMSVPFFDYREHREELDAWATRQGEDGLARYRAKKNTQSIDGLPALSESTGS